MEAWQAGIALAVGGGVVGLVALAVSGMRKDDQRAQELDHTVVEQYCRLVAEERYEEAHRECLTAGYRKQTSVESFAGAQKKRRAEAGSLQSRELVRVQASRNLFSRERTFQLTYRLRYPGGERHGIVALSDTDGEFRVDGTCREGASSESLDFEVW